VYVVLETNNFVGTILFLLLALWYGLCTTTLRCGGWFDRKLR